MPPPSDASRRPYLWVALLIAALLAGLGVRHLMLRNETALLPKAGYLVGLDESSRLKFWWGKSVALPLPLALPSGKSVKVPAGSRVAVVRMDSGQAEIVTGPAEVVLTIDPPSEPDLLVSPLSDILENLRTQSPPQISSVRITSPMGVTRYLNPLISWNARDGVLYDIAVADPADPVAPVRIARGMRPPVPLADLQTTQRRQLQADRIYEIVVREAGSSKLAAVARVLTRADATVEAQLPTTPADLMIEAATAMAIKPTRTGDAWMALTLLPDDWARSELGVRLRLLVAAELGLAEEFTRAQEDARRLPSGDPLS